MPIKDLGDIANWIDVETFDPEVDPVAEFVERYKVKQRAICGRCGRRNHFSGWASILESGTKVVVGHCCAVLLRSYRANFLAYAEKVLLPRLREKAFASRADLARIRQEFQSLLQRFWSLRDLRASVREAFPSLFEQLLRKANANDPRVKVFRRRDEQTIDLMLIANPQLRREEVALEEVLLGSIDGIELFGREILSTHNLGVEKTIARLEDTNLVAAPYKVIRKFESEIDELQSTLDKGKRTVDAGSLFLSTKNLHLLRELAAREDERRALADTTEEKFLAGKFPKRKAPRFDVPISSKSRTAGRFPQ